MVDPVPLRKVCKSIIKKWLRLTKKSSSSKQPQVVKEDPYAQTDDQQARGRSNKRRSTSEVHGPRCNGDTDRCNTSPTDICKNGCFPSVATVSRSASRRDRENTSASFSQSARKRRGMKSSESIPNLSSCKSMNHSRTFSRAQSRKSFSSIMLSDSSGMLKPLALERNLECSLEELCHGCKKKIIVTRDIIFTDGSIDQKEEVLTIDVQPGWTKGTKVIFEGKENDKRSGGLPADIIFIVVEKRHPLFRREGDDLELTLEIPLSKALTGGEFSVPLLGGESMGLVIDDVIFPGYEKIISGKGMPNSLEQGKRGNLKLSFLVDFPTQLTDKQRSEVVSILQNCCDQ